MTLTRSLIILTLASGSLWAQTPAKTPAPASAPAKTPATATAKPAKTPAPAATAAKPGTPAPKPAAATATPVAKPSATTAASTAKPAATAPVKPAAVPVKASPAPAMTAKTPAPTKPVEKAKAAEPKKPADKTESPEVVAKPASAKEAQTASRVTGAAGRRDPFVSPIVRATTGAGPVCETGKRCLMVDQIVLKGIVKSPNGFIAVVENPMKRAYFLRENDPVFNGSVVKITGDSVLFREATTDKLGKQSTREVVKKVNAPVV